MENNLGKDKILNEGYVSSEMEKVYELINKVAFKEAMVILKNLIDQIEKVNWDENKEEEQFFSFTNIFEEILYRERTGTKSEIIITPNDYSEIYFLYAASLVEKENYDEAIEYLESAMRWNPCNVKISFEYAECHKLLGELEDFYYITIRSFENIYKKEDMARFYRNMGYYLCEKKQYNDALCCYMYSIEYDDSERAYAEMEYIDNISGISVNAHTMDNIEEIFAENEIPMYPSKDVLGIAFTLGKSLYDRGSYPQALFFFEIFNGLIKDATVMELIEDIKSKLA